MKRFIRDPGKSRGKPDVLATVKQLFEDKEFGKFYKMPPGIVRVRDQSATYLSTDANTKLARCSVLITVDLLEMLKKMQGFSDEQLATARQNAERTGQTRRQSPSSTIRFNPWHQVSTTSLCYHEEISLSQSAGLGLLCVGMPAAVQKLAKALFINRNGCRTLS